MESRSDWPDLVRCMSCRRVYDLAFTRMGNEGGVGCPDCGAAGWLAERVPIEESAVPPRR
jgi:DNA-directed RNA polymerase subunit RPC12/RpoP